MGVKNMITVTTADICKELRKNHKYFDDGIVAKAYSVMINCLKRKGLEREITRYLNVAYLMARLGFGVDIVTASFLAEAEEDGEIVKRNFGITAMRVTREYQCFRKTLSEENDAVICEAGSFLQRAENNVCLRMAFLIHLLMTVERFYEIKVTNDEAREQVADYIRSFLLPVAQKDQMCYFVDLLEDVCFDAKERRGHRLVKQGYSDFIRSNSYCERVVELFKQTFVGGDDSRLCDCPSEWRDCFENVIVEELLPKEIYDSFCLKYRDIETELDGFFSKANVRIFDIFLVVAAVGDAKLSDAVSLFLSCYEQMLLGMGFAVLGVRRDERSGLRYFLLRDRMMSFYRVYIVSRYEYMKSKLGVMTDCGIDVGLRNNAVPETVPHGMIRVYDYGNNPWVVGLGTTVLDFAFMSDEKKGVCFQFAEVFGEVVPPDYVLCSGDRIRIVAADVPQASLEWFRFIKTVSARESLIRFLHSILNLPGLSEEGGKS